MLPQDVPAPPPGFELDQPHTKRRTRSRPTPTPSTPPPPPGFQLVTPDPVDGDTVRTQDGPNARIWGIDAPELAQLGYRRDGSTVPIGEVSRDALATALAQGTPRLGEVQHSSYGRPVAAVDVDGVDAGKVQIRSGNALSAPQYLGDDEQRRYEYAQAERLARQNRLGMHGVFTPTPPEFRADPDYVPTRETIAVGFDTPTPNDGLTAEQEQRLSYLYQYGTYEDIEAFNREIGAFIDPEAGRKYMEEMRTFIERRDKGWEPDTYAVTYAPEAPPILTDNGDGATGATARSIADGFLASGLDEVGAFVDMAGLTPGRENVWNSDRRWADIWYNNQRQNSSILGYDDYAYPTETTLGYVGGSLATPWIGGKINSARGLMGWGAAYAGAEGFLGTDGDVVERGLGAIKQAPLGAAGGLVIGKGMEAAAPHFRTALNNLGTNARADFSAIRRAATPDSFRNATNALRGEAPPTPAPRTQAEREAMLGDIPAPPPGFSMVNAPRAAAMDADPMPSLSGEVARPQPLNQPLSEAQRAAMAANVEPRDLLPVPSNLVEDADELAARDAGRFAEVKPLDERGELNRRTLTNWRGQEVPKVGPVDLVGFVRSRGGLHDEGGELSAMGITSNAARQMDFVGQETRFGPMVNNTDGLTLDEAGEAAWEAGYFNERPTTAEFLDTLRGTYDGYDRRFLMGDEAEVARFYDAQAERSDLESRIADEGALYSDRSYPAEGDQPFAPPEAFEDWGSNPPAFADNIRLDKLDSPQDISRALSQSSRQVGGFDAATRGRITQAETERLAAELNLMPDKLLSRRNGQALNAEEALAARQILAKSGNELVNFAKRVRAVEDPGDELLAEFRRRFVRHVALQEQVSGATAEAGRALAQFRMAANSRAVKGDVLNAFVRAGGGTDRLQEAADVLIDAAEAGPGVFNAVAKAAQKPRWRDKLSEFYINMLLSGPQTHVVNMVSNTMTTLAQPLEYATASAIGAARKAAFGKRANPDWVSGTEVGARTLGLIQGTKEGAKLFGRALKSGEASDFASKVEGEQFKAIKGIKGEAIRIPTRLLTAEDELFKGVARRMELNASAARIAKREGLKGADARQRAAELVADPTDEMYARALEYGRYLTFQQKLGPLASKISGLTNESLVAKVFMPFVRTPTNLLKFATERSPAAPLLREWRADFKAGGAKRDLAVAKMLLGTGFAATIYQMALDGKISGSAPSDPKKKRLLYADGWQPYSVKVGDNWYSYKRFDPFSTTIGFAADMALLPEGMTERQKDDKATLLVASMLGNLSSKTWLSGMSDLISALDEPDRYADNLIQRMAGSFTTPSLVAQVARNSDPVYREADSVGEYIQSRIPGLSDNLLPRRNIWGEPIERGENLGPDLVSPVYGSAIRNDPVNQALMAIDYAPGMPSRTVGGRELTAQEYDLYVAKAGQASKRSLDALVVTPQWKAMDAEAQRRLARKIVTEARRDARAELFGGPAGTSSPAPAVSSRSQPASDAPPPPPDGFSVVGDAGGVNIFKDVQEAIPGVRVTSGFRSQEYQADMRRRGYKPARNSAHLSGSALDLTPPRGKSMGWLAGEVRRLYPNARVLNEGDHIHVEFPGYYGAPPLGGAVPAGVSNPNAGMPPPPPGFTMQ